ncbi:phosphopantetheine-binding protein [Otoolea muris]|uniref:phosphopantetheine-binding protein n=1 Tax=Otoolea muris TaxID=2941515 RepID=UPI00203BC6A4|nr:phosphopantetheine-binding protein [Otoolea muris]
MEETVLKILMELNEEILTYKGDNLYRDGLLDSFQVIDLAAELEEKLGIEIDPEMVILENFANKDAILGFVKKTMEEQDAG